MIVSRKWRIQFDIKNIGILFYLPLIVCLISLVVLFCSKDVFTAQYLASGYVQANYAALFDFVLPVILFFNVLVLFSEDMKNSHFSFISSLPLSKTRFILLRYLRLLIVHLIPYLITLFVFYNKVDNILPQKTSFFKCLFLYLPSCLFFMGFALFTVILTRKLFYSAIICGGYLLIDAASLGTFLQDKTVLLSMYLQNFTDKQIIQNRLLFLVLGVFLPILAYLIASTKIYKKMFY